MQLIPEHRDLILSISEEREEGDAPVEVKDLTGHLLLHLHRVTNINYVLSHDIFSSLKI